MLFVAKPSLLKKTPQKVGVLFVTTSNPKIKKLILNCLNMNLSCISSIKELITLIILALALNF